MLTFLASGPGRLQRFRLSALDIFTPFQTASDRGNGQYPTNFTQAYGYNTLLLNNDSAAILNVPTGRYMTTLQEKLTRGSHFIIEAEVEAYVATRNASTPAFVTDDQLWDAAFDKRWDEVGLATMSLYKGNYEAPRIMPFSEPVS